MRTFGEGVQTIAQGGNIKDHRIQDAVLVRSFLGEPQLWVRPTYRGYRYVWISAFGAVPEGKDVDHVYSKARRKPYKYEYVRLALVEEEASKSKGKLKKLMGRPHQEHVKQNLQLTAPEIRYATGEHEVQLQRLFASPAQSHSPSPTSGPTSARLPLRQSSAAIKSTVSEEAVNSKVLFLAAPQEQLKLTPVTIQRPQHDIRVVTGPKSYDWHGDLIEMLMGFFVTPVNYKLANASSHGFTAEIFMYAYVLAYGTTARDAYFRYMKGQELRTGGTVSQGTFERRSKVERHIWVSGAKQ